MTAMLRADGQTIDRKRVQRVQRLMWLMGIATFGPRPRTRKPAPLHKTFPYLLRDTIIERPSQVWSADITWIPIGRGFMYLVAAMGWSSRAVRAYMLPKHAGPRKANRANTPEERNGRLASWLPFK